MGQGIPPTHTINVAHLTEAVGTTFNVFSYDAVWAYNEPITSPTPGGCATSYATDAGYRVAILIDVLFTGSWWRWPRGFVQNK